MHVRTYVWPTYLPAKQARGYPRMHKYDAYIHRYMHVLTRMSVQLCAQVHVQLHIFHSETVSHVQMLGVWFGSTD